MNFERLSTKTAHLLRTAAVTPDHFKNLGSQHTYEFGAIAEFVDNSSDAGAKSVRINSGKTQEGNNLLYILDDGLGMSREECTNIAVLGDSKKAAVNKIGRFGTGLKSGAMKLAEDFILFTKKDGCLSSIYMGTSASRLTGIQQVAVAVPSFDEETLQPVEEDMTRHNLEMSTIFEYSPFSDMNSFLAQFHKIPGSSGTLLVLYNFHLSPAGKIILDFDSDEYDIQVRESFVIREFESLREYLSILYVKPKMKIYLRGKKVFTKRLPTRVFNPRQFRIETKLFKTSWQQSLSKREAALERIQQESNRVKGELSQLCVSNRTVVQNERLRQNAERFRKEKRLEELQQIIKDSEHELKELKERRNWSIIPIFGFNVCERTKCGLMLYSNGRLIRMYEKMPCQESRYAKKRDDWQYGGVLCILDIPYSVVEPSTNKENLSSEKEFKGVLRLMSEYLQYYWVEQEGVFTKDRFANCREFWASFGYSLTDWVYEDVKQQVLKKIGFDVQCDSCGKWRKIPYTDILFSRGITEDWTCLDHPNPNNQSCNKPEAPLKIRDGRKTDIRERSPGPPSTSFVPQRVHVKEEILRETSEFSPRRESSPQESYQEIENDNSAFISLRKSRVEVRNSSDSETEYYTKSLSRAVKRSIHGEQDSPTKKFRNSFTKNKSQVKDTNNEKRNEKPGTSDVITLSSGEDDLEEVLPRFKKERYEEPTGCITEGLHTGDLIPREVLELLEGFAEMGSSSAKLVLESKEVYDYKCLAKLIHSEIVDAVKKTM